MTVGDAWPTSQRKGSLSKQLLPAIKNGSAMILDMARKAQKHTLGEECVAKAWKLLNQDASQPLRSTRNPRRSQIGRANTTRSSSQSTEK